MSGTEVSRSVHMDYERYRTPTVLFPCYECATLTTHLPDASGVALCDQHQDPVVSPVLMAIQSDLNAARDAGLWTCCSNYCGWTNTSMDATCQRCGCAATDGYGFRL